MYKNIRKLIYITLGTLDKITGQKNNIAIYCYHGVGDDGWKYTTTQKDFENQLKHLLSVSTPITLKQIENRIIGVKKITKPSFAITFDDGYAEIVKLKKLFKVARVKPAVFIIKDPAKRDTQVLGTNKKLLSAGQIKELKTNGWTAGSHSQTHKVLTDLSDKELAYEVKKGSEKYFCYPKGKYNNKVLASVKKAGFSLAFSMDDGFITQRTDLYKVPRIGVDSTHSFEEFKVLASPSVVRFRKLIKMFFINKYL